MQSAATVPRLATGIAGLDRVLHGGLITGDLYVIGGTAGAGKTTLASQIARVAEQTPDLVLCDVMMPVLDGVTFVERLRADQRWATVPVVLMTAVVAAVPPRVREKITGLLQKPFTLDSVVELIGSGLSARPPPR